ncbi:MAG: HD domain-containing protein [Spirochaetaceae bacterium]|jgi:poly(A) polymerase|nr:HD domain-containing protein [Spirochaetaceae bacterium]
MQHNPCETLIAAGYGVSLGGFSAVDRYLDLPPLPFTCLETDADLSVLGRLFEGLRFPGVDLADGVLDEGDHSWYFRCIETEEDYRMTPEAPAFRLLSLTQDWQTRRFRDPQGVYPLLRRIRDRLRKGERAGAGEPGWTFPEPGAAGYRAIMEGALILARYGPEEYRRIGDVAAALQANESPPASRNRPPGSEAQRRLLTAILVSPQPDRGMELLKAAGFIEEFWPEFSLLDEVGHSKEFHPEGNVWHHTMETFRYRKPPGGRALSYDLRLSLGLLLHDVGKPLSASSRSRPFDGHAELGARAARKFLERLEFPPPLIDDVCYLVKNHMIPAALPRLPLARTAEIMASPLFPTLMELYRCDESSSFKGLDAYYESSAAYQAYLRYRRNPYRSADGKVGGYPLAWSPGTGRHGG